MFVYEMHQHTMGCSACAIADPVQTVKALHEAGFAGMVMTNHFYHGNTGIRRHQPWDSFVAAYEQAYELARWAGDALDFDVLFGIEEGVRGGKEVLIYGITPTFLYAHPHWDRREKEEPLLPKISKLVREAGGLVIQAHPFRVRDYIDQPWEELPKEFLDGMETYNVHNSPMENIRAENYARENGLIAIAGTDAHDQTVTDRAGIACDHRLRDGQALVEVLKSGNYSLWKSE